MAQSDRRRLRSARDPGSILTTGTIFILAALDALQLTIIIIVLWDPMCKVGFPSVELMRSRNLRLKSRPVAPKWLSYLRECARAPRYKTEIAASLGRAWARAKPRGKRAARRCLRLRLDFWRKRRVMPHPAAPQSPTCPAALRCSTFPNHIDRPVMPRYSHHANLETDKIVSISVIA